jgi:hypothetical protein
MTALFLLFISPKASLDNLLNPIFTGMYAITYIYQRNGEILTLTTSVRYRFSIYE